MLPAKANAAVLRMNLRCNMNTPLGLMVLPAIMQACADFTSLAALW